MARSAADLAAIKAELTNDPNGLGLTVLEADDALNATKLNEVKATQLVDRKAIPVSEIAQQINLAEYSALSQQQCEWLKMVMQTGSVAVNSTGQVKQGLLACFGENTATRAGLLPKLSEPVNRIEQMYRQGLLEVGGYVNPSEVAQARLLP